MSNLIITVIAIVLVSIAAIMAIFYGGAAFEAAQAKGIAVQFVEQAAQINNAVTQWQMDHGGGGFLTQVANVHLDFFALPLLAPRHIRVPQAQLPKYLFRLICNPIFRPTQPTGRAQM